MDEDRPMKPSLLAMSPRVQINGLAWRIDDLAELIPEEQQATLAADLAELLRRHAHQAAAA